jgi:transposase
MSPEYVRSYVKSQKSDDRNAEAIAEAATRPTMRFVELKSEERLDALIPAESSKSIGRAKFADQTSRR